MSQYTVVSAERYTGPPLPGNKNQPTVRVVVRWTPTWGERVFHKKVTCEAECFYTFIYSQGFWEFRNGRPIGDYNEYGLLAILDQERKRLDNPEAALPCWVAVGQVPAATVVK